MVHSKWNRKQQKPPKGALQHKASTGKLIPLSRKPAVLVYHCKQLIVSANPGKLRRQPWDPAIQDTVLYGRYGITSRLKRIGMIKWSRNGSHARVSYMSIQFTFIFIPSWYAKQNYVQKALCMALKSQEVYAYWKSKYKNSRYQVKINTQLSNTP
jgi:hypothetical protein